MRSIDALEELAIEEQLQLVNVSILAAEFVVGAYVLANVTEGTHGDLHAEFLLTFTPQSLLQGLAWILAAPGKRVPFADSVTVPDRQ